MSTRRGIELIRITRRTDKHVYGLFICGACGREYETRLRRPRQQSCGCVNGFHKHGEDREGRPTPELKAYRKMRERCLSTSCKDYINYGGRGIKIDPRWLESYNNFLADMGRKPGPGYSIERLDVNGDYTPTNCMWADRAAQANNTRRNHFIVIDGTRRTVSQWLAWFKVSKTVFYRYLNRGESPEYILKNRGKLRG